MILNIVLYISRYKCNLFICQIWMHRQRKYCLAQFFCYRTLLVQLEVCKCLLFVHGFRVIYHGWYSILF